MDGSRTLWVNIRTFSPLPAEPDPLARTRLRLCLVSFTWRSEMASKIKMEEEEVRDKHDLDDIDWEEPREAKRTSRMQEIRRALLQVGTHRTYGTLLYNYNSMEGS